MWFFVTDVAMQYSNDDKLKRILHAWPKYVNGLTVLHNIVEVVRNTFTETEFNKSTNLFMLFTLCTYMKIHRKNINTSHSINFSGAQSQPATHHCILLFPTSPHYFFLRYSATYIVYCRYVQQQKINRSFCFFFFSLAVMLLSLSMW